MIQLPSPIQEIKHELFKTNNVRVDVKRDDLIHPEISGNKWRKLYLNIEKCKQEKHEGVLTFGGAFSNHIAATAAAGKLANIHTIGIIRGEYDPNNPTIQQAKSNGMQMHFVSREEYSWKEDSSYQQSLREKFKNYWIVPEGGYNYYGMMGCVDITNELEKKYNHIVLAAGTGTTATGVLIGKDENTTLDIIPVLKGDFMKANMGDLLFEFYSDKKLTRNAFNSVNIHSNYHFGGFTKYNSELVSFMNNLYSKTSIPTDIIYTGKLFYALFDLVKQGYFKKGSSILVLHSGGLQGNQGMAYRKKLLLNFI